MSVYLFGHVSVSVPAPYNGFRSSDNRLHCETDELSTQKTIPVLRTGVSVCVPHLWLTHVPNNKETPSLKTCRQVSNCSTLPTRPCRPLSPVRASRPPGSANGLFNIMAIHSFNQRSCHCSSQAVVACSRMSLCTAACSRTSR